MSVHVFSRIRPVTELTPDDLSAMGVVPQSPLCQRCNREATFENPVGIRFRPSWDPFLKRMSPRGIVEALCAACREKYA